VCFSQEILKIHGIWKSSVLSTVLSTDRAHAKKIKALLSLFSNSLRMYKACSHWLGVDELFNG